MNTTKLDFALHYSRNGTPVLPLHYITPAGVCSCGGVEVNPKCKPGKHPFGRLVPHGLVDATTDETTIRQWFEDKPFNIGICTGAESGFFALDRDDRDGGAESLTNLEAKNSPLPSTLTQRTGNGVHYLFRMPTSRDVRNSTKKLAKGLDIRGTGGYICAAPSVHENGRTYSWEGCELPTLDMIADAPRWLLDLIDQSGTPGEASTRQSLASNSGSLAQALLAGLPPEFTIPEQIGDGEGRESFLLKYAGHLRAQGLDQSIIERILLDYNRIHIQPPLDDAIVLDRARRYEKLRVDHPANDTSWPEPDAISSALPSVPPFDQALLPPVFRSWVGDIAERMQCPVEFLAVGAMVAAGAVVGNRIGIQPKQRDTSWIEVANLWGAVVGRPGVMKTPALAQVLAPIKRLEAEALSAFSSTRAQYAIHQMQYDAAMKTVAASIKKHQQVMPDQMPVKPEEPQPPRLLVNDATYQKLGTILSGNPHGVLEFQDELAGLLVRLDSDGQEAARTFFLEGWNGLQPYTFDRIERGTVRIPRLCFSLLGGLQPSKLREYLRSAVYGGKGDDGLAQRLQLLVYPDISTDWKRIDRRPDMTAAAAADAVFDQLATLDPVVLGARMPMFDGVPVLCFSDDAQHLFNLWWEHLEKSMRHGERHPALESHMSKYRKLVPAIALLDHLILGSRGSIQIESLKRAIGWQRFLYEHAKRAYAAVTLATMDSAKALSGHIRQGALKNGFTVRDIYRHNWSMLGTVKEATEAVEVLIDLGWLRSTPDSQQKGTDGRPTVRYAINPRLKAAA